MLVALRLFETQGFYATTVSDITTAAEVARRTFFRYFPTKVDVLFADHDEQVELLRDTLANRASDESILDAVRRATLTGVGQVVRDPELFLTRSRLVLSIPDATAHSRYLDAEFEAVIAEAEANTRQANAATDLRARVLAKAAWSAARSARETWVESGARSDPRQLVNDAFDLLDRGLG